MRKCYYLPILSLLLGVAGAFFRERQMATGFDSDGLAVYGNIWAILLAVLSAVAAVLFILFLFKLKTAGPVDGAEIGVRTPVYPVVCGVASAFLLAAGMIGLIEYIRFETDILRNLLLSAFAVITALCTASVSLVIYKGKDMKNTGIISTLPVFFMCFWLIVAYREHAANPVIYDYVYQMLAIICGTMGFFYSAGFVFGKNKPARAVFFMLMSVFFSLVIIAETQTIADIMFFVFLCVYMFTRAFSVLHNLSI